MPIDFPLSKRRKETLFKIYSKLPKYPKEITLDEISNSDLDYSRTTIHEHLHLLISLNAVTREKKAGGIYYYCTKVGKKELEFKLEKREKKR